jgi:hypothetical protein
MPVQLGALVAATAFGESAQVLQASVSDTFAVRQVKHLESCEGAQVLQAIVCDIFAACQVKWLGPSSPIECEGGLHEQRRCGGALRAATFWLCHPWESARLTPMSE